MEYPKLPTGPTTAGAAGVRGLQADGGDFQRTRRTADTESKRSGEFSRATVEGAEYVITGEHDDGDFKFRAMQRYIMPGIPSIAANAFINMGRGRYASWVAPDFPPSTPLSYTYTVRPGDDRIYTVNKFSADRAVTIGGFYGQGPQLGGVTYEVYTPPAVNVYFANLPSMVLTRPAEPKPEDQQLAVFLLGANGRADSEGRVLQDIFLLSFYRDGTIIERFLNTSAFADADAEFWSDLPTVATKNCTYTLVAEKFFEVGAYTVPANPKVYILRANNHNLDSPAISDVTTQMMGDRLLPTPTTLSGSDYWIPTSGDTYSANLSRTLASVRMVAMPDDWVLCFYRVYCDDAGTLQWRARMVRFRGTSGMTITRILDEALPSDADGVYYQSAVHLGGNWVLAKRIEGFDGINFDMRLTRSADGGLTWEDVYPLGFHAALKNQFFGDLVVHKARADGEPGIVLMTAWDATALAYHVYESRNDGTSWVRKGRVYKPDVFRRVDTMVVGDGGGNFDTLVPGPDPVRPVDVTIPDRYTTVA